MGVVRLAITVYVNNNKKFLIIQYRLSLERSGLMEVFCNTFITLTSATSLTVPNVPVYRRPILSKPCQLIEKTLLFHNLERIKRVYNFKSFQVSILCFYKEFYYYSLAINFYCHYNKTKFYKNKAKLNIMLRQPSTTALLQE